MALRCSILLLLSLFAGCNQTDPQILAAREQFLVSTVPDGERPIPDVQKDLKEGKLKETDVFTVRAHIDAGDFAPFGDGQAAFMVTDAAGHDGKKAHNPHDCPFCKRDINSVMARVEFKGADGNTLKIDARQLFDLKEKDLVVVEGTGRFNEENALIISASKIFVKR